MKKLLLFAIILAGTLTACKIKAKIVLKNPSDSLIVVDYGQNLAAMIKVNQFDWFDTQLINAASFPMPSQKVGQKETLAIKLFDFSGSLTVEAAIAKIIKAGYRPATIFELLAFGTYYPELQKQFPIIALGSPWQSYGGFPYLSFNMGRRTIDLAWNQYELGADFRFLAVQAKFMGYSSR